MDDATTLMTSLSEQECWVRLRNNEMGRLAVAVDGRPDIFPVNYFASGSSILFRTAGGTKFDDVTVNHAVAFEVDHFDQDGGWSIVVRGTAKPLTTPAEIADAESAPLKPWIPTDKPNFVRIDVEVVTGRAVVFALDPRHEGTL
ncbi:hypothetical protein ARHIZOSPH14_19260 [Agromyces rhizosphaerae]|uniref:Pyridoxamine 5'-phosphate oxidase family protein n=1 Tax=Agromyces rhizosphaerae TaxID=88374 RepID=A0A9W6CYM4_9MICO|nr:pyridoxamine 5'-phosphate oxidase family protein [Agromyces rhizosphaerae]GLI27684.1 hypothetical protein ARHIZOSPH14_19260 [Agromyces rhizosphaerae]